MRMQPTPFAVKYFSLSTLIYCYCPTLLLSLVDVVDAFVLFYVLWFIFLLFLLIVVAD